MTIPKVVISIETEGQPRLELRASDEDADHLLDWLAEARTRKQLARLVALVTGETIDD